MLSRIRRRFPVFKWIESCIFPSKSKYSASVNQVLITEATQVSYETEEISEEIIYPQNLPTYLDFGTSEGLENSPLFENDPSPPFQQFSTFPLVLARCPLPRSAILRLRMLAPRAQPLGANACWHGQDV